MRMRKKQHELKYHDTTGHTTMTFDPTSEADVEEVRRKFADLIKSGYMATTRTPDGLAHVADFDPEAAETVMVAPIAGGS